MYVWKILFFVIFSSNIIAQEWNLVESPHIRSIVSIEKKESAIIDNMNVITSSNGTGVVIDISDVENTDPAFKGWYAGKILTCQHLKGKLRVKFHTGQEAQASIIKEDEKKDIMILSAFIPKDVEYTPVGELKEDVVLVNGLGGNASKTPSKEVVRSFNARVIGPNVRIYLDGFVIPGDSGGPITSNGYVVGVVQGGYEWFKDKVSYTFPIISVSNKDILEFCK